MSALYALPVLRCSEGSQQSVEMGQSRLGGASCRSSHVRNAPLATVGPKKAACRDGPEGDIGQTREIRPLPLARGGSCGSNRLTVGRCQLPKWRSSWARSPLGCRRQPSLKLLQIRSSLNAVMRACTAGSSGKQTTLRSAGTRRKS